MRLDVRARGAASAQADGLPSRRPEGGRDGGGRVQGCLCGPWESDGARGGDEGAGHRTKHALDGCHKGATRHARGSSASHASQRYENMFSANVKSGSVYLQNKARQRGDAVPPLAHSSPRFATPTRGWGTSGARRCKKQRRSRLRRRRQRRGQAGGGGTRGDLLLEGRAGETEEHLLNNESTPTSMSRQAFWPCSIRSSSRNVTVSLPWCSTSSSRSPSSSCSSEKCSALNVLQKRARIMSNQSCLGISAW